MMKKEIFALTLAACLPAMLSAQAEYGEPAFRKEGQQVWVSLRMDVPRSALPGRYKLVLTPYITAGTDTAWLQPVEYYGRTRLRRERQEHLLRGDKGWQPSSSQLVTGTSYDYRATVPYERWMRRSTLGVQRRMVGCGCDCYDGSDDLLPDYALYQPPTPVVNQAEPQEKNFRVTETDRKWDFGEHEMKVQFRVSKWDLLPDLADNRITLDEIVRVVRLIGQDNRYSLGRVEITGYASPEGPVRFNAQLGDRRSKALRDYLKQHIEGLTDEDFRLVNGVEDWPGLRKLVAASGMKERDEVLRVLDDASLSDNERKARLKTLGGGRTYRYLLDNLYPQLRSACYIAVYYDRLSDVAADAINRAVEQTRRGQYAEALRTVEPYKDDARAYNVIGVCHMMMENETEAIRWLRRAAEAGDETARQNLRQIE